MPTAKILLSLFLGMAVVIAQVSFVQAAPPQQDGALITGTIQSVVVEPGFESDRPTVVTTLLVNGETKISRMDFDTAVSLRLIVFDEQGNPVVDISKIGTNIQVDPDTFAPDEPAMLEETQHPVGARIAEFFSGVFTVDYELVMSSRSNGFGFGVISQALWMTEKLGGDATLFQTILDAKKSNDYAGVVLPEGAMPQTWGQLKKAVLHDEKENPGEMISDGNGNGNDHQTDQGVGTNKDDEHSSKNDKPVTPPGQSKEKNNNGNSDHPVATPPGQSKDKDTENNGNSENSPGQNKDKDDKGKSKTK